MMRRLLLLGAAAFMASAAHAADLPGPAAHDWTGPSVGLQGGYGWGENDTAASCGGGGILLLSADVCGGNAGGLGGRSSPVTLGQGKGSIGLGGFVGGLNAGYDWQIDNIVLGVTGDIELADMDGDSDLLDAGGADIGRIEAQIDWLGSLRLRAGFAVDRALFYATGGLAVGGVELSLHDTAGGVSDDSAAKWGWTLGGGLDYALTDTLSARIEYRYTDLGGIEAGDASAGGEAKSDIAFHAVRVGLGWHF